MNSNFIKSIRNDFTKVKLRSSDSLLEKRSKYFDKGVDTKVSTKPHECDFQKQLGFQHFHNQETKKQLEKMRIDMAELKQQNQRLFDEILDIKTQTSAIIEQLTQLGKRQKITKSSQVEPIDETQYKVINLEDLDTQQRKNLKAGEEENSELIENSLSSDSDCFDIKHE